MYTSFGAQSGDHHIVFHNISQPAKHPHYGLTTADYTIPQKPPLVPSLGLLHVSPKVDITPSFPSTSNIRKTGKQHAA
jgi:hypothetical protein